MFYFRSKNEAIITSVGSTIVIVAGEGISDKADVEIFSKIDDLQNSGDYFGVGENAD